MSTEGDFTVCYVTAPNHEVATTLAKTVLESKTAACVNIIPHVESMYWWDGQVQTDKELLLMIKTRSALVSQLTSLVIESHPYDVCEVIAVPITAGNEGYLNWIRESTKEAV